MISERNNFVMTLVIFIHFVSCYVAKWYTLFVYSIYGMEETTAVEKTSVILFSIK